MNRAVFSLLMWLMSLRARLICRGDTSKGKKDNNKKSYCDLVSVVVCALIRVFSARTEHDVASHNGNVKWLPSRFVHEGPIVSLSYINPC